MYSPFLFFGITVLAVLTFYFSVPTLLWGLEQEASLEFEAIGSPTELEIFSRQPSRAQLRFLWFVMSGKAYSETRGTTRTAAVLVWLGYAGFLLSIAGLLIFGQDR